MAEGNAVGLADGSDAWKDLVRAVDEAVIHRVCGSTTTGANGLPLWYPQTFDAADLDTYAKESPLSSYAQTLRRLYGNRTGEMRFADAGSQTSEGRLGVTIDPGTAEEFFDVRVVNEATDGSYQDTNLDIADDWDNLTIHTAPLAPLRSRWMAWCSTPRSFPTSKTTSCSPRPSP